MVVSRRRVSTTDFFQRFSKCDAKIYTTLHYTNVFFDEHLPILWRRAGVDLCHGLGFEVDLRLGWEEHIRKSLHGNVCDHADDWDKQN